MNRAQRRRARQSRDKPNGYPLIRTQTARQLHNRLVQDALNGVATPLPWAVLAYQAIAARDHCSVEAATRRVHAEVHAKGRLMPGTIVT